MNIRWPWKTRALQKDINALESELDASLRPVAPRTDFVRSLRDDLVGKAKETPFFLRSNFLLISGAVLSGLMMIMAGARSIISFLAAIGLIRQISRNKEEQDSPRLVG